MKFSLFYFDGDDTLPQIDKFKLLIESAKFSKRYNFPAIWTPERHFSAFSRRSLIGNISHSLFLVNKIVGSIDFVDLDLIMESLNYVKQSRINYRSSMDEIFTRAIARSKTF